jgi:hypothetical protein
MKRVYGARDLAEAYFVKGLLDAEEIPAVVQGGALQAVLGEVPVNPESLPSVWVNEQDVDRAMQIISEMKEGGPATIEPQSNWTCPKCGEVLEGQFSNCWKCGTERPKMT